jgi:P27 family predicted phage terminase small subunit
VPVVQLSEGQSLMGARGPIAKLALVPNDPAKGNPGKRKPKATVRAKPGVPNPPSVVKGEALAEWKRVTACLDELGLVAKIDRAVLTLYVEWWQRERELAERLEHESLLVLGSQGQDVANPIWAMHRDAADRVVSLAEKLLATPIARLRANLPEDSDGDEAEGILD